MPNTIRAFQIRKYAPGHEPYMDINPNPRLSIEMATGLIETTGTYQAEGQPDPGDPPRVIYTQRCWWYPERSMAAPELGGCLESNTNVLTTTADDHCDPYSGSWANRGLLCRVYKVNASDMEGK